MAVKRWFWPQRAGTMRVTGMASIYFLAFKDSFNKWEPIGGGCGKTGDRWKTIISSGTGLYRRRYRARQLEYIPIPALLPLASIGYGPATFRMTYIPPSGV
ncbi:hypothetical protein KCP78_01765 [Salmonella enterica subsp. enterica]|nr:hypothetical protein KCP78_01765 [Salmonella enterica subsp. enterica]